MSSEKLTLLERILFFLGSPKRPTADCFCFKCKSKKSLIDLGDGDIICDKCWNSWIPSYQ